MSSAAVPRAARPNGWWGAAIFLATEATLFGSMLGTYYYLRFNTTAWPPRGVVPPDMTAPLILTGALVLTTVPMFAAVRAAVAGRQWRTWLLVLGAFAVQAAYLGIQAHFFLSDLDKVPARESAYAAIYHTLLGTHHAHVLVGLVLDVWVLARLLGGLTDYRVTTVRVAALYWYVVNALAVLVVLTQISPRL
jgi:heme/copper-type cytochrome/quinol oxidase subunit 3